MRDITLFIAFAIVASATLADDAATVFNSLYGDRFSQVQRSRDFDDDLALAKELLAAAASSLDQPDLLAVLCHKAHDLASRNPAGFGVAIDAMKRLAANVEKDRAVARAAVADLLTRQTRTGSADQRKAAADELASWLAATARQQASAGEGAEAVKTLRRALVVATQFKLDQASSIKAEIDLETQRQRVFDEKTNLEQRLLENAGDKAAAADLVRLCLIELDDPKGAYKYVDRADDADLTRIAALAGKPADSLSADEARVLAYWYHTQGKSAVSATLSLQRTHRYLTRFLQQHTTADLETKKAELLLKQVSDALALILDLGGGVKVTLVRIKAGTFTMGSPASEKGRNDHEGQKSVQITDDFYMGETEVTQAQWKAVMNTTPWKGEKYVKEGDNHPATFVSWNDAQEFVKKASALTGKTIRLPAEAEWEYACRAGTTTAYHFGDSDRNLGEYAWYGGLVGDGNAKNEQYAHQVKTKKPNPWGLYDMHGNVWEWCEDKYDDSSRVLRGGSWDNNPGYLRSAGRNRRAPGHRINHYGFRVCVSVASPGLP